MALDICLFFYEQNTGYGFSIYSQANFDTTKNLIGIIDLFYWHKKYFLKLFELDHKILDDREHSITNNPQYILYRSVMFEVKFGSEWI